MEKEIEVETFSGKQKEILNPHKDILLGEKTVKVNYYHVVSYKILGHKAKDRLVYYYIHYFAAMKEEIKEYIRIIRKETAIIMLSRMKLTEEQEYRINDLIPNFESEREKIQLFDRVNDYEGLLTDKDILKILNQAVTFHYYGHHVECSRAYPHAPHILGVYHTVRYGSLPIFCTGKSGKLLLTNGRKVHLLITSKCTEGCWGSYLFFGPLEE